MERTVHARRRNVRPQRDDDLFLAERLAGVEEQEQEFSRAPAAPFDVADLASRHEDQARAEGFSTNRDVRRYIGCFPDAVVGRGAAQKISEVPTANAFR